MKIVEIIFNHSHSAFLGPVEPLGTSYIMVCGSYACARSAPLVGYCTSLYTLSGILIVRFQWIFFKCPFSK